MASCANVVPLALYLALFQIIVLRQLVEDSWLVTGGLFAVIVGLMLFMEGLKLGLMPFGEVIGNNLPRRLSLPVVLLVTLLIHAIADVEARKILLSKFGAVAV